MALWMQQKTCVLATKSIFCIHCSCKSAALGCQCVIFNEEHQLQRQRVVVAGSALNLDSDNLSRVTVVTQAWHTATKE